MQPGNIFLALKGLSAGILVGLTAWFVLPSASGEAIGIPSLDDGSAIGRAVGAPSLTRAAGSPTIPFGQDLIGFPEGLSFVTPSEQQILAAPRNGGTLALTDGVPNVSPQPSQGTTLFTAPDRTSTVSSTNAPIVTNAASAATTSRATNSPNTASTTNAASTPRATNPPNTASTQQASAAPAATSAPRSTSAPTTAAPRTTAAPTTAAPRTTVAPTTAAPRATVAPTTAAAAVVASANSSSSQGCVSNCQTVGFQDLSGQSNVTLENLIITNPNGRCLDLSDTTNITIRNVSFISCGTDQPVTGGYDNGLILIDDARNITIENSILRNMSNESFGEHRNNVIQIDSSTNITIRNNSIRDVHSNIGDKSGDRGNRAIKIVGSSSQITIDDNHFYNAGRNAVQFSRVRDAAGINIRNNIIEGRDRWDSDYEDMVNLYSSSGTANDPILVSGNTFKNGGPSTTGTGIIVGDGNTSSGATQYVIVANNSFIDPGHVGINLAGGNNITVRNNTIVGTGDVPHRTTTGFTINHYGYSSECRDHVVTGNRVWMENQHLSSGTNHHWNPGTCNDNVQLSNNVWGDESLR